MIKNNINPEQKYNDLITQARKAILSKEENSFLDVTDMEEDEFLEYIEKNKI